MKISKLFLKKLQDELKTLQGCTDEMYGHWDYHDGDEHNRGHHWTLYKDKLMEQQYKKHLRSYLELREMLRLYEKNN